MTRDNSININMLLESFIDYYGKLIRNSRRGHFLKVEAAKALETVSDILIDFQEFLATTIGLNDHEHLSDILEYAVESEQGGRN